MSSFYVYINPHNTEVSASSFPQICIPRPVELQNRNTTKWYSDVHLNLYIIKERA